MRCTGIERKPGKIVYCFEETYRTLTITLYYHKSCLAEGVQVYGDKRDHRQVMRFLSYDPDKKRLGMTKGEWYDTLFCKWEELLGRKELSLFEEENVKNF